MPAFYFRFRPDSRFKRMPLKLMMKVQEEASRITLICFPHALFFFFTTSGIFLTSPSPWFILFTPNLGTSPTHFWPNSSFIRPPSPFSPPEWHHTPHTHCPLNKYETQSSRGFNTTLKGDDDLIAALRRICCTLILLLSSLKLVFFLLFQYQGWLWGFRTALSKETCFLETGHLFQELAPRTNV